MKAVAISKAKLTSSEEVFSAFHLFIYYANMQHKFFTQYHHYTGKSLPVFIYTISCSFKILGQSLQNSGYTDIGFFTVIIFQLL